MNKTKEKELDQLTDEEKERIILQQGRKVLMTINTDGWGIIENALKVIKMNAEDSRKKANRVQSTRDQIFYWNGVVDGVEDAIQDIYKIVALARQVESDRTGNTSEVDI